MSYNIVGSSGDPCPRCGRATEIREHRYITAKELRRPFYYSRWFFCRNPRCKTSTIVLPEYRVSNAVTSEPERRMTAIAGQLGLALEDEVTANSSEVPVVMGSTQASSAGGRDDKPGSQRWTEPAREVKQG